MISITVDTLGFAIMAAWFVILLAAIVYTSRS